MRAHTRTLHTKKIEKPREAPFSADEAIKKIADGKPEWAIALSGLRYREDLTQKQLGNMVGVDQGNISNMENGKRPIGKNIAKKLAELFHVDYRVFL